MTTLHLIFNYLKPKYSIACLRLSQNVAAGVTFKVACVVGNEEFRAPSKCIPLLIVPARV